MFGRRRRPAWGSGSVNMSLAGVASPDVDSDAAGRDADGWLGWSGG